MYLIFLLLTVVVNIRGDLLLDESDDEIDKIFDDLLNGDYDTNSEYDNYENKNDVQEEQPKLTNGVWQCGNCTTIDESQLLFSDSLDLDSNYNENSGLELQIGFSVSDMRCIRIETEENTVRRVSGACAGEEVTLSVTQRGHFEVKIYK